MTLRGDKINVFQLFTGPCINIFRYFSLPFFKQYRMPPLQCHYFEVLLMPLQATPHHNLRCNFLHSSHATIGYGTFLNEEMLFLLAMNSANALLPSRFCSTARHTSCNLVLIFFARISWLSSYRCSQTFLFAGLSLTG